MLRERIFLLAYRDDGRKHRLFQAASVIKRLFLVRSLQGLKLLSEEELHRQCHRRWNGPGKLPLHLWLNQTATEMDKNRLRACGNCVIPACARLACQIHAHRLLDE